jgi:hypothetical protein
MLCFLPPYLSEALAEATNPSGALRREPPGRAAKRRSDRGMHLGTKKLATCEASRTSGDFAGSATDERLWQEG